MLGSAACGDVLGAVCTDTGVNSRTCACGVGLSGIATVTAIADDADIASLFSGTCVGMQPQSIHGSSVVLTVVDNSICVTFASDSDACGGVFGTLCSDTGVNTRTCQCQAGLTGPIVTNIADSDNTYVGPCTGIFFSGVSRGLTLSSDVNACALYGSDSLACGGVANSVCVDDGQNSRTCACAPGYHGALTQSGIPDNSDGTGYFTGTCSGTTPCQQPQPNVIV